jgi:hypothetical protein
MRQRIVNIFLVKPMKAVGSRRDRIVTIHGFVVPEFAKKNRGEQFSLSMIDLLKAVICIMRLWLLTIFTRWSAT